MQERRSHRPGTADRRVTYILKGVRVDDLEVLSQMAIPDARSARRRTVQPAPTSWCAGRFHHVPDATPIVLAAARGRIG
jgi:hypothetical protein